MAVASDHSLILPQPLFGTASSSKISTHMNAQCSDDSDDDYGYVASLAEQIAHAMLDEDEDCAEDAFVRQPDGSVSCSPLRKNAGNKEFKQTTTTHNSWSRTLKMSGKISDARASLSSASSPLFVPAYRHDFTYFAQNQAERTVGSQSIVPARSTGMPLSPAAVDSSSSPPVAFPSSENVANYASPKVCGNKLSRMRDCRGNLDLHDRDMLPSSGRNRHRRHLQGGSRRHGVCHYCGQASPLMPWHEVDENGASTVLLGYGNARKETAGTGVFLPRIMTTGSNYRKKSASKIVHVHEDRKIGLPQGGNLDVLP